MPSRTAEYLALQVKDGSLLEWQLALIDLALMDGTLDPDQAMLHVDLQETVSLQ